MPAWLTAFIATLRAWLGIRAEIQEKRDEHEGRVVQQNADLTADLKEKMHEAEVFAAPDRTESAVLDDMLKHAGK